MHFKRADIERALKEIENAQKVVIITHRSPDGDAIGSSLGFAKALENWGKEVTVVIPDAYASVFNYLEGNILDHSENTVGAEDAIRSADLLFCLDHNDLKRVGNVREVVDKAIVTKILIDHHPYPSNEFDIMFSSTSYGSTAEMVFHFLDDLDSLHLINEEGATALMTGIITDTGSFKYGTSAITFSVASQLVGKGAKSEDIQKAIFDQNTISRLRLNGYALSEKLEILEDINAAIISLNGDELERFNFQKGDTEGLVNQALSIKGIKMAVFVQDRNGETRLSFRSQDDIEVNKIATENFNGGGHDRAAGGISELSVEETVSKLKEILPNYA
ncbi:MAG: bifunctional oligoribonuclease/PAP phosphatase NrnA [Flavobacteriales bacterium]|nr:bifunctional oligoribonuclease/PAP phosphatase NrnA [Flavobacteriales bacterium]